MKKLKILLLMAFLVLGMQQMHTQVYKFKTTGFSVLEKSPKGTWGKWSDLQKAAIVITIDTKKNRIIVYSQEIQLYEIMNYEAKEESDTDEIYPFTCRDIDGMPFTITLIIRKKQDNRKQLYIKQKNFIIAYNIETYNEEVKK